MQHDQSLDLNALNNMYWKRRVQQCKTEFKDNSPRPAPPSSHSHHRGGQPSQPSGYLAHESTQPTQTGSMPTNPVSPLTTKLVSTPIQYEVR